MCIRVCSVGLRLRVYSWTDESSLGKSYKQQRKYIENNRPTNQHIPMISTASLLHTILGLRTLVISNICSSRTNVILRCIWRNQCCRGKVGSIEYYECGSVNVRYSALSAHVPYCHLWPVCFTILFHVILETTRLSVKC